MRVLMLGWEFPPSVSGGLGTACRGLTRALARSGTQILFALPRPLPANPADRAAVDIDRLALVHPSAPSPDDPHTPPAASSTPSIAPISEPEPIPGVTFATIPALSGISPYAGSPSASAVSMQSIMARLSPRARLAVSISQALGASLEASRMEAASPRSSPGPTAADLYTGDVVAEAGRYAEWAVKLLRNEPFDVIHAHDWMTFPAAMALAAATGKPFIAHVHSTEVDRAGPHLYQPIFDIERQGMHAAQAVICVSHLTAGVCHNRYAVAEPRLHVVYNGIDPPESPRDGAGPTKAVIERTDRVVLFLGRITMQKGPEYFIAAAQKVLRVMPEVKFIMAGSGDLSREVMQLATAMGIGSRVLFTGFLRGKDVERVFQLADVYVMPSVSEPFGIAPLEAIRHDVPAIISRSSGVAEVLRHVLKVDFWNTDDMADKIVAVLRHEPLSRSLRENAELEVRQLTWDGAAAHCVELYESLVAGR